MDFGAQRPIGMTYSKIIEAYRVLRHGGAGEPDEEWRLRVGPRQFADLRDESRRYGIGAVVEEVCGFNVVINEGLPYRDGRRLCYAENPAGRVVIVCKDGSYV